MPPKPTAPTCERQPDLEIQQRAEFAQRSGVAIGRT